MRASRDEAPGSLSAFRPKNNAGETSDGRARNPVRSITINRDAIALKEEFP